MSQFETENQFVPICPWCGEELDPADIKNEDEELSLTSYSSYVDFLCYNCSQPMEIITNLVYTTYKSENVSEDIVSPDLYDEEVIDFDF